MREQPSSIRKVRTLTSRTDLAFTPQVDIHGKVNEQDDNFPLDVIEWEVANFPFSKRDT